MSSTESSQRKDIAVERNAKTGCNCGWEVRFGYGVAVTLAIFEAKRFFMLILEIFAEWQVIRLAGGLRPVIFTLVDVGVGLPTALISVRTIRTIRTIRTQKVPRRYAATKGALKRLLLLIAVCAVVNTATLVSIGCHVSVRQETLIDIFNGSMQLYVHAASYKYTIDEIQLMFQCCGHTSYRDWFSFDWQRVDYASREEMREQDRISDEAYRDRGVPFSCCNLRAMRPCVHAQLFDIDIDVRTINPDGCAGALVNVLLRIVVIAYVMTSTLVVTEILLAFLIFKIVRRRLPATCRLYYYPPASVHGSSSTSSDGTSSEAERRDSSTSPAIRKPRSAKRTNDSKRRRAKRIKRVSLIRCIGAKNKHSPRDGFASLSSSSSSSPRFRAYTVTRCPDPTRYTALDAAKIKPSAHEQHTVWKKPICDGAR